MRTGRLTRIVLAAAALLIVRAAAGADDAVPIPEGYRMSDYRAPTPARVPGAGTVSTDDLRAMVDRGGAILIDVLPAPPRPADRAPDAVWLPPAHRSLPGAVWLPNVGYGALSDDLDAYFRGHLQRLTGGRRDRPLVFFCEPDCWMSWNAARRAVSYGYTGVHFYPEGVTGWSAAGLPLEPARPAPPTGPGG